MEPPPKPDPSSDPGTIIRDGDAFGLAVSIAVIMIVAAIAYVWTLL